MTFKDNVLQFQNLAFSIYMSQYIVYTKFYCHLNIYISTKNRLDAQFTIRYTLYKEMRYIENVRLPYPCWINSIKTCLNKFTINFLILNEKSHPQFDHIFLSEILQKNIISIVVLFIYPHNLTSLNLLWSYDDFIHNNPPTPQKKHPGACKEMNQTPPPNFIIFITSIKD